MRGNEAMVFQVCPITQRKGSECLVIRGISQASRHTLVLLSLFLGKLIRLEGNKLSVDNEGVIEHKNIN